MKPLQLDQIDHEKIKKYVRQLSPGEFLFSQGDKGNTLFIIVSGEITLIENHSGNHFVIGQISAGEILGEKALLNESTYTRKYTARAESSTILLEFTYKQLALVQTAIPDLTLRIFEMASRRLDRANQLISLLRTMDPVQRVVESIQFLSIDIGKKSPHGIEIPGSAESIYYICYVPRDIIRECLQQLQNAKLITNRNGVIVVPSIESLTNFLPELKERIAA